MKYPVFVISLLTFTVIRSAAQISPPGLGLAHTANWLAAGIKNKMNRSDTWQSVSYIGMGRKSAPDNYNPVLKQAIWVINQEFYHQTGKRTQFSLAVSYRRQDEYRDQSPYKHDSPGVQQEFRLYGRMYYTLPLGGFHLASIFRQEFRKFYAPDFSAMEEDLQLRSRFRLQLSKTLDKNKTQKIIASAEALFASSKATQPRSWMRFDYKESRFSLYYSRALEKTPVVVNIGYMNNLLDDAEAHDVHYFALDIIVNNPFN